MKLRSFRTLIWNNSGAVAPTVALSLFGLIAAGGIAFDYARMASMDTELQNAADQAALAAASQLDGEDDACSRAAAAAANMLDNSTLFANDGAGTAIIVQNESTCDATGRIRFWQDIGKSLEATTGAEAKFVEVDVDPRTAFYALTPIAAALSSDPIIATAFAGLGEAVCNTPPVMMCNPSEPTGNVDEDYPFTAGAGDGLRLVIGAPNTPGNFGFLQTGFGTGAQDLARALGYDLPPADCAASTGVDTEPGDKQAVRAAFNTRFDMSEAGQTCPAGGTCSPSENSRKDLVKGSTCTGPQAWSEADNPYRPTSPVTPLDGTNDPEIMGLPRDMCHAVSEDGACGPGGSVSIIGDGEWDRDAYFRVNYGWDHATWRSNTGLGPDATRYQVYKWEMDHPADVVAAGANVQVLSNGKTGHSTPVCRAPGVIPNETTPDRRRIPIAVVNCNAQGLSGRETGVEVVDWYDVFLVEPAYRRPGRTTDGDIYVEVIGEVTSTSNSTLQVVKKAVPYLIE